MNRTILPILSAVLALSLTGCASPTSSTPAPQGRPVNLINPGYPPAVAGTEGWVYHKTIAADLDGDGADETVHVTNSAGWDPEIGEFMWDDGHPWHVYVEEADGTRTYLFSDWVQLGRLKTLVSTDEPPQVVLLSEQGAGIALYKVAYKGPGEVEAVELANVGIHGAAEFVDPITYQE